MNRLIQQATILLVTLVSSFSVSAQCSESEIITPTISILPVETVCEGSGVTFTTEVFGGGISPVYEWQYGNGPTQVTSNSTFTLVGLQESLLEVQVRLISSERCKTEDPADSTTLNVVASPSPLLSIKGDTTICEDQVISISAHNISGSDYQWYKDGIALTGEIKPILEDISGSGEYYMTETNNVCGEESTTTIEIFHDLIPEVDAGASFIVVAGDELNLSGAHTGGSAVWSSETFTGIVDDRDLNTSLNTIDQEGSHTITLTVVNGACRTSDETGLLIRAICIYSTPNQALSRSARSSFFVPEVTDEGMELELEVYNEDGSLDSKRMVSQNKQLRADELAKGLYAYCLINPETGEELRTGAIQVID